MDLGRTKQPSAFHLPEVCRQTYAEVGTLAYSTNTFLVRSRAPKWVKWVKRLMPAERDAIASVELGGLESYWNVHAARCMSLRRRGLRHLTHCYVSLDSQKKLKSRLYRLYPHFAKADEQ